MCPKFKDDICEVAGIEAEYVEYVDESLCYKNSEYEQCRLYIVEYLINHKGSLSAAT